MRTIRWGLAAVAALACLPASARAQYKARVEWQGVKYTWNQGSYQNVARNGTFYISPYLMGFQRGPNAPPVPYYGPPLGSGLNGSATFGPTQDIFCIDYLNNAAASGKHYDAYLTRVSDGAPALTKTRSNDLVRYKKAAWLAVKSAAIIKQTSWTQTDKNTLKDLQGAMWQIMTGTTFTGGAGGISGWVNSANTNYLNGEANFAEWTIVTDACVATKRGEGVAGGAAITRDGCGQEFLVHNVVPEPATLILLGTGLLVTLAASGMLKRPFA